jgi:ATP-dependent Lon protease
MAKKNFRLKPDQLRWSCDPKTFKFKTTADLKEKQEIYGQQKALKAMKMGLAIASPGYNVFLAGPFGTGKMTTVKSILEKLKVSKPSPNDKCYLYNFKMPDMPCIVELPAGKGKKLKEDMQALVSALRTSIPKVFESESYEEAREEIISKARAEEEAIFKPFQDQLQQDGMSLIQMKVDTLTRAGIAPLVDGKPIPAEEYVAMVESGKITGVDIEKFKEKYFEYDRALQEKMKSVAQLQKEIQTKLEKLDRDYALYVATGLVENLKYKYQVDRIAEYLEQVQENVVQDVERFKRGPVEYTPAPGMPALRIEDPFLEYQVNVVVDNSETKGVPIIIENSPTFHNLFGTIETSLSRTGEPEANHMRIKAGAMLRADGGYLVFNADDALGEPHVWKTLKRALISGVVEIPSTGFFPLFTPSGMKPEPVEISLKVVMIGNYYLYRLLYAMDEDFRKIFKIKSDFALEMPKSSKHIRDYAAFINGLCNRENLPHLDREGAAAIVEFGVEQAGRQEKLSTRFSEIADVIREAGYLAKMDRAEFVGVKHIEQTLKDRIDRVNQVDIRLNEQISDGRIRIETSGAKVGQINGLVIYNTGDYTFGKPSRITAETTMGRAGIVSIDRQAKLTGSTHDKGVLVMSGYLRAKYAQDKPLTLSATLCFEQSYASVDGDSASSTELYALISSLAQVPIRQNIAVTGSVDQKGNVQVIGGVNEKIEGFFKICQSRGLKGDEGVIIPERNKDDLMLNKEIVEAVRKGKFHIYAVKTIEEGLELLTGMTCGRRSKTGKYRKGTLNRLVADRLEALAKGLKDKSSDDEKNSSEKE